MLKKLTKITDDAARLTDTNLTVIFRFRQPQFSKRFMIMMS